MKMVHDRQNITKRNIHLVRKLIIGISAVLLIALITWLCIFLNNKYNRSPDSPSMLSREWKAYDYQAVYNTATLILSKKPLHNKARTYLGYAAFYLAVSENDTAKAQDYLEESINNIRIAILSAHKRMLPQLHYMLGKAYFYRDSFSSYYYYADLAVFYLNKARTEGYKADDIPEYLGLSYAALGRTMDSISAFTEALIVRESDTLLLAIAEQYYKAGQAAAAEQYLFRVNSSSKNEDLVLRSHTLLGQIYLDKEDYVDAEKEFNAILEKNENSADAYYGLGVIYEKQGDLIKARSLWRKALRIQVNHPAALKKMADYK